MSSQDPSFAIYSKERINPIDYVTFILGTVGTWLGISMVSFNPVPMLFVVKQGVVPIMARQSCKEQQNSTENRMRNIETQYDEIKMLIRSVNEKLTRTQSSGRRENLNFRQLEIQNTVSAQKR